jgi:hypothetical protein
VELEFCGFPCTMEEFYELIEVNLELEINLNMYIRVEDIIVLLVGEN